MKNNKIKIIIILLIIMIVYGGIVIIFANNAGGGTTQQPSPGGGGDNPSEKDTISYLLVDDIDKWAYQNNYWRNTQKIDDEKLYNVYVDNVYKGNYYLKFIKRWNLFDTNDKYVQYEGKFLGHSTNMSLNIQQFEVEELSYTDFTVINKILDMKLNIDSVLYQEKINIDLDSNGIKDTIINISNTDVDYNYDKYFNLIYVILNGKEEHVLVKNIVEPKYMYSNPTYNMNYILKINKDKYSSLIFTKSYFSEVGETTNVMYQYNNGNYTNVVE